ncbi:uncharacterized protein LOC143301423 [Babylonia areolata]|uniref:uncharacterized protein LOC143301423 n=1 Tax=Babylonia areolata TaxID=304850 RepID=UPI003FD2BFDE
MEFTFTKRNKRKLLHEGYAYVMDRTKADNVTIFWRCEKRGECKGRLKTVNDVLEGRPSTHSHPPSAARCLALKAVGDIKQRAEQSEEATSSIINNCTAEFPLAAAGSLPKKETLARMIRRKRKAPDSDIISEELKLTTRGEQFLAFQTDDIVILTTPSNLDVLARNAHWFCDGTFDSAPLATQLYTIHVLVEDTHTLPLVYCVTQNKNRATYDAIFTYLNGQRDLNPETITIDFERAALNSISEHFPTTAVHGCFFHFGQCLWRNLQSLGLQDWYLEPENSLLVKTIQALAFVPPDDVIEAFQQLMDSLDADTDETLSDFLAYFESTWLGIVQRGRRRRPKFDVAMWNVYNRVGDNLPRTNNSVEGWHRAFDQRMSVTHPTLGRLVSKLRKEQASTELMIEQRAMGVRMRKNKQYEVVNTRLQALVARYAQDDVLVFLKAVAHNL